MIANYLKKSAILLTVISLMGCADGLPPFPAEYIYSIRPLDQKCSRHRIVSKDPLKVDNGEMIPWEECPTVFGFSDEDAGKVFNWVRNAQKESKERCK
jgi:hypothetical protein